MELAILLVTSDADADEISLEYSLLHILYKNCLHCLLASYENNIRFSNTIDIEDKEDIETLLKISDCQYLNNEEKIEVDKLMLCKFLRSTYTEETGEQKTKKEISFYSTCTC